MEGLAVSDKWQGSGDAEEEEGPQSAGCLHCGERTSPEVPEAAPLAPPPTHTRETEALWGGAAGPRIPPPLLLASGGPSAIRRPAFRAQCILQGLPGRLAQSWAWR